MTLTTFPNDPLLDLPRWAGQRSATFRFDRFDSVSHLLLGQLHPIRTAQLAHDTTRTIKRQLSMTLGQEDTAAINPVSERVDLSMVFGDGTTYPLGRYMYSDETAQRWTSGNTANVVLNDEMFRVDQPITKGIDGRGKVAQYIIELALRDISDIDLRIEGVTGQLPGTGAWTVGTRRGQVLEETSVTGGYFSPWFGNDKAMHFIQAFDPADQIPDFDFDSSNTVLRAGIVESSNLLTAPNRFVVISNSPDDTASPVIGTYDVPNSAPNSIANRGFVIAEVKDMQISTVAAATVVARNIGLRNTIFETTNLQTVPDPRHDSYNVVFWQGSNWLELGWSMNLTEGGTMNHVLRKAYSP